MSLSAAERKQLQRDRARALGLLKVEVWVAESQAPKVRDFARSLPAPEPPTDPRQIDWLREIDAKLDGGERGQGSLI